MQLADLDAAQLAAGYAEATFTPVDVIEALDARIAAWEPSLHALYAYDPASARAQAEASARRW
ncbi:amidase, partial [Endobacter medicaginis]|nr:amidase [Endobacter medicaginis]